MVSKSLQIPPVGRAVTRSSLERDVCAVEPERGGGQVGQLPPLPFYLEGQESSTARIN